MDRIYQYILLPHSFEFGDKWVSLGRDLGGMDAALIGIADPDRRAHMPDENLSLASYRTGIKWVAGIYREYAGDIGSGQAPSGKLLGCV